MLRKTGRPRAGLSAGAVILVTATLLIALGLLLVWVSETRHSTRGPAYRTANASNLRQLATAVNMALDQNKTIPPYFGVYGGKLTGTFHYHLLPFVESTTLWNVPDAKGVVPSFLSPSDESQRDGGAGAANYVVNYRLFYSQGGLGELQEAPKLIKLHWKDVSDGTSCTLLFATKYHVCGNGGSLWYDPNQNAPNSPTAATFGVSMNLWQRVPKQTACDPLAGTAASFSPDYMQVVFCDATVHVVSPDISPATWQALHTYAANDVVGEKGVD